MDYTAGHLRSGMAVASTDPAATIQLSALAALMAHQLVDHPGGNAGVFQPGRERVPQIVGPVELEVGQVGACTAPGAAVQAAEVVPRQQRPRAGGHAVATSRTGEDQGVGVAARGERELPDAGVAFRPGFETTAEPAGLVARVDHLEYGGGSVEVDPAAAQPGQLSEAQARPEEGDD